MTCNVAFIGLGVMGYPMAGYISKAGHNVTVFNRTKTKAEKWISEYKGKMANTPAEAAEGADFIFTCVGNDNDLREVATGENGLFKTAKAGHNVTVFNRTKSKAEKWIGEYKGKMAETPAEAAKDAEYIFTCVGNDNDLREVTFGDNGIFKTIKKGSVYVDNTTASAGVFAILPLYSPIHFSAFDLVLLKTVTLCPAFDIYPAIG